MMRYFMVVFLGLILLVFLLGTPFLFRFLINISDFEKREMVITELVEQSINGVSISSSSNFGYKGYIPSEKDEEISIPFIPKKYGVLTVGATANIWYHKSINQVYLRKENQFYQNYQVKRLPAFLLLYLLVIWGFVVNVRSIVKHHKSKKE